MNPLRSMKWAMIALNMLAWGAGAGTVLGLVFAANFDQKEVIAATLCGTFFGAIGLAAIPATIAIWYLFLTMLSQASSAVKGNDDRG